MKRPSPRIKPMRTRLAHALFGASLMAVCLGATLLVPVPALAQVAAWQAAAQPIEFVRGQKHWSETLSFFVVLNPDGNLVVARADGGYVWGFDTQPNIDHRLVGRVVWQPDGNLVAYDSKGGYLWSALSKDLDSNARLVLQTSGALQIVSPKRGVLWSTPAATPVAPAPAPVAKERICSTRARPLSEGTMKMVFINHLNEPVALQWIGFNCEAEGETMIRANGKKEMESWPGYVFRAVDSAGRPLDTFKLSPDDEQPYHITR